MKQTLPYNVKKSSIIVENLSEAEDKRRQLILQIQKLYSEGYPIKQIARLLGNDRKTIRKYLKGDPDILCKTSKLAIMTQYKDLILRCLESSMTQADVCRKLKSNDYCGSDSNVRVYIKKLTKEYKLTINKYSSFTLSESSLNCTDSFSKETTYITRNAIFKYLWMNSSLSAPYKGYIFSRYPVVGMLDKCIKEFRDVFQKKNPVLLHLLVDSYKASGIKEISSLALSLKKDFEAVENAVSSDISSGFVEGTNSKVKMIKHTMYGRCGLKLLSAKLMYKPIIMPLNTEY